MSQPYIGEIRMLGNNFAINGWAFCNGQLMPIDQNTALFQLIGTTYGGDGVTTFALPDLQCRIPVHQGTGGGGTYVMGQKAGEESVTLTTNQLPVHTHVPGAALNGGSESPGGNFWGKSSTGKPYVAASAPFVAMNVGTVGPSGGSQPHDNLIPFECINFIISLFGVFPSQN